MSVSPSAAVCDVVVVGVGMTGLAAALSLSSANVSLIAIDPLVSPSRDPRAASMDDWAQRVLSAECPEVSRLILRNRTQLVTSSMSLLYDLPPVDGIHGCSEIGFFFQPEVETALRSELLRRSNVTLLAGWTVTSCEDVTQQNSSLGDSATIREDSNFVILKAAKVGTDETLTLRSRFVIGCDGGSSTIRSCVGMKLVGTSLTDSRWFVVDAVECDAHTQSLHSFRFICDPDRPGVDCRLPSGHIRFEWQLHKGENPPTEEETRRWILRRGIPRDAVDRFTFIRQACYTFHARQSSPAWITASRRVILAGDSAHLCPPMRGQVITMGSPFRRC
jgi:3-(3-hydroxy-phenyl)propionate hydroxylase